MTPSFPILGVMVAAPAVAAFLLLLVDQKNFRLVRGIAFLGASVALLMALLAWHFYDPNLPGMQMVERYPIVPSLGISLSFGINGWGVALEVLTGVIIVGGVLASYRLEERPREFFVLLLTLVAGVFGVFVSQDLFIFFLFYEIAVLPMYLLIAIWGSSHEVTGKGPFGRLYGKLKVGDKQYAAMKLTLMLLAGSAVLLVGILAIWKAAGGTTFDLGALGARRYDPTFQKWVFPLVWLGFGALAGVFPFHTWSPDGHASAPTAVSMLHAGVLMKLGAFGVIRVGMILLPDGAQAWAPIVGSVAALNIVYGALGAMWQKDFKYVVAYSSVSHMGVVMLGAATLSVEGMNGAVFQMFAHGIMTGMLFALVGVVYERSHTRHIPSMGGFGVKMPATAVFFTLAALSSLGLPGTPGFIAEFQVIIGAFITAVYILGVSRRIFWGPIAAKFESLPDLRRNEWGALLLLSATLLICGVWPRLLLDGIDATTVHILRGRP